MSRMRLSRALVTISLAFIIAVAFVAVIQKQKEAGQSGFTHDGRTETSLINGIQFNLLTPPNYLSPFFIPPSTQCTDIPDTLASPQWNSTRTQIYDFIKANPGVNFRGICNQLGLSIGLAQFHLGVLTKAGLVSFIRDGKYKRLFIAKRFSKKQMRIIAVLRHETAGAILRTILERKQVSHNELTHELSITSQGLTWHINRLEKNHLVTENKDGKKLLYSLDQASTLVLVEMADLIKQA
jgi:DNA-binding transcriptional ArsR family regulator